MMLLGLAAAGLAVFALHYLKLPKHERCPAGRRKKARKSQAKAHRMLRDPKRRGDRASHRAARRLLRLSRKPNPRVPLYRPLTTEEQERSDREMNALLDKWTKEAEEKAMRKWNVTMKDGTEKVVEAEKFIPAANGDASFWTRDKETQVYEEVETVACDTWKTVIGL